MNQLKYQLNDLTMASFPLIEDGHFSFIKLNFQKYDDTTLYLYVKNTMNKFECKSFNS